MFFLFLYENIYCGSSLEMPHWGTSNEYYSICFHGEIRKICGYHLLLSGAMLNTCAFRQTYLSKQQFYQSALFRVKSFCLKFRIRWTRICLNKVTKAVTVYCNNCLHRVDSSITTLWTSLFPIAGCLVSSHFFTVF